MAATLFFRHRISALIFLIFMSASAYAQDISNYVFTATNGTYTAITSAQAISTNADANKGYENFPIGFDFWYMGRKYTKFSVSTNGWIALRGNISDNGTPLNNLTSGGFRPIIAPLWDDLGIYSVGIPSGGISYKLEGAAGNRVLTIQWSKMRWNKSSSGLLDVQVPVISFQAKLYENGNIKFIYLQESGNVNEGSASIGITALDMEVFRSLNNTSSSPTANLNTETTRLSARPANNQTYTFDPTEVAAPTAITFSQIGTTGMTLSWKDNANNEAGFAIYRSSDNENFSYIAKTSADVTTYNDAALEAGATYYYKVYAFRENLSAAASATKATVADCSNSTVTLSQVSTSNIVADYKMNGNANDFYNNNPGKLQGDPVSTTDRNNIDDNAYHFDGTSQYFTTTKSYNNPTNFTISVWFNTTSSRGGYLLGFSNNSTSVEANRHDRHIYISAAGKLYFGVYNGQAKTLQSSNFVYNDGRWHMATATMSSSAGIKLYVDGILVGSDNTVKSAANFTGYWRIGAQRLGSVWPSRPSVNYFAGDLDDVHIYNRELSAQEIGTLFISEDGVTNNGATCQSLNIVFKAPSLPGATYIWSGPNGFLSTLQNPTVSYSDESVGTYTLTVGYNGCSAVAHTRVLRTIFSISQVSNSGIVAYYKMDGNANDFYDNNQGRLRYNPQPTTDRFDIEASAYRFNGTSQYIYTSNSYRNPNNFTTSIWFKTTSVNGGYLIGFASNQTSTESGNSERNIYVSPTGSVHFATYNGSFNVIGNTDGKTYNDGKWHMAAATFSSTGGMKLYLDGLLVASNTAITSAISYRGYWRIAAHKVGSAWPNRPTVDYFAGSLDDVHIYNRVLSASEIAMLYTSEDGVTNNGPVCVSTSVNLTAPNFEGAAYSWTGPNNFYSTLQNPTLSYTPAAAGVYTVTVSFNGCTAMSSTRLEAPIGGSWTGDSGTNWSDVLNWCDGLLPTSAIDVTIASGLTNYPLVSDTQLARNLNIASGASITITGSLSVAGNVSNSGTLIANKGKLVFNGAAKQVIPANLLQGNTIKDLAVNNAFGVDLQGSLRLTGLLMVDVGEFNTGGFLTLASNANTAAQVGPLGNNASIIGQVTVERYITGGKLKPYRTYRMLSSPVYDNSESLINVDLEGNRTAAFSQLQDDVIITGTGGSENGFDATESNQPSAWTYSAASFRPISNTNAAVNVGRGMYIFYRGDRTNIAQKTVAPFSDPENTVVDFIGVLNQKDITVNLDYAEGVNGIGFNLLGNPYACTLDWSSINWAADKVNLRDAVWIWNPATRSYATYIDGEATMGGSRYIAPGQSFFVQTNAAGAKIKFKETVKAPTVEIPKVMTKLQKRQSAEVDKVMLGGSSYSATRSVVRVSIKPVDSYGLDETLIVFSKGNLIQYDHKDALHLNGDVVNIASVALGGEKLAINFYPEVEEFTEIPLYVASRNTGSFIMRFNIDEYFSYFPLLLKDKYLDVITAITKDMSYSFDIDKDDETTFGENRFSIVVEPIQVLPVTLAGFTAKADNNSVLLSWTTLNEIDNKLFKLFRAGADGKYVKITEVQPKGAGTYNFTDVAPFPGINYYKLVQVDFNGAETEAGPLSVSFALNHTLSIYPNPVVKKFTVQLSQLPLGNYHLKLYHIGGQKLRQLNVSAKELEKGFSVNISDLASGLILMHLVNAASGELVANQKLIKNTR